MDEILEFESLISSIHKPVVGIDSERSAISRFRRSRSSSFPRRLAVQQALKARQCIRFRATNSFTGSPPYFQERISGKGRGGLKIFPNLSDVIRRHTRRYCQQRQLYFHLWLLFLREGRSSIQFYASFVPESGRRSSGNTL